MLNIEKYKDTIINAAHADLSCCVRDEILHLNCIGSCRRCKKEIVNWLLEEYSGPILDDAERKYLSEVFRPFRKDILTVSKYSFTEGYSEKKEYIKVSFKERGWALPSFKAGTMYKGMKAHNEYTLKELGL